MWNWNKMLILRRHTSLCREKHCKYEEKNIIDKGRKHFSDFSPYKPFLF